MRHQASNTLHHTYSAKLFKEKSAVARLREKPHGFGSQLPQFILGRFRRLPERERLNVTSWPHVRGQLQKLCFQVCFYCLNFSLNALRQITQWLMMSRIQNPRQRGNLNLLIQYILQIYYPKNRTKSILRIELCAHNFYLRTQILHYIMCNRQVYLDQYYNKRPMHWSKVY